MGRPHNYYRPVYSRGEGGGEGGGGVEGVKPTPLNIL